MTRTELYDRITQCLPSGYRYEIGQAVEEIWGQPFDGETERIKPTTEESSATLSESFPDGITYTRSYQVFLLTPSPTPSNLNDINNND